MLYLSKPVPYRTSQSVRESYVSASISRDFPTPKIRVTGKLRRTRAHFSWLVEKVAVRAQKARRRARRDRVALKAHLIATSAERLLAL